MRALRTEVGCSRQTELAKWLDRTKLIILAIILAIIISILMLLMPFEEGWLSALRLIGPKSFEKKRQKIIT
jgi:Na+/melibiose symporter-like transporter